MVKQIVSWLKLFQQTQVKRFIHDPVKEANLFNTMRIFSRFGVVLSILALFLLVSPAQATQVYRMVTGQPGGDFYSIGTAFSTLVQLKNTEENDVLVEVRSSTGVIDNMHALLKGEADIAFVDASTILAAAIKAPPFDKYENTGDLQALALLWPDVAHLMMHSEETQTGYAKDFGNLLGNVVSFGSYHTSSYLASKHLFRRIGLDYSRLFKLPNFDAVESANRFIEGQVSGFSLFSHRGNDNVEYVMATDKRAKLLDVSEEELAKLNHAGFPIWSRYVIPAHTYTNQTSRVNTVAQSNFLVVKQGFDNDHAYHISRTLFENLTFVKVLNDAAKNIDENAFSNKMVLSLHPGTQRYLIGKQACSGLFCLFH